MKPDPYSMDQLSSGFKLFWRVFPRKVGKYQAWKCWVSMNLEDQSDTIIAKTKVYPWPSEIRYVPHPQTFLRNYRWLDEHEEGSSNDQW